MLSSVHQIVSQHHKEEKKYQQMLATHSNKLNHTGRQRKNKGHILKYNGRKIRLAPCKTSILFMLSPLHTWCHLICVKKKMEELLFHKLKGLNCLFAFIHKLFSSCMQRLIGRWTLTSSGKFPEQVKSDQAGEDSRCVWNLETTKGKTWSNITYFWLESRMDCVNIFSLP